jgi:hypothetical protein
MRTIIARFQEPGGVLLGALCLVVLGWSGLGLGVVASSLGLPRTASCLALLMPLSMLATFMLLMGNMVATTIDDLARFADIDED